jgi:2-keto-4-pentenoate hydratase
LSVVRDVDSELVSALREQFAARRKLFDEGAAHVGWKLGMGDRESIGGSIAVGHLTSATCLEAGATYVATGPGSRLHADAELAVELDRDGVPAAWAGALEIVDLALLLNEPRSVVATNVFHRAVAFGPFERALPRGVIARLVVDGHVRASGPVPAELGPRLAAAARLLEAVGEHFRAGDRVITGSVVQVPIEIGDDVVADFGALGAVRLSIGA